VIFAVERVLLALMRHATQARRVALLPIRVQTTSPFGPLVSARFPSETVTACGAGAHGAAVPASWYIARTRKTGAGSRSGVPAADGEASTLDPSGVSAARSRHEQTLNCDQLAMEADRAHRV
jgi:hypothetical protein